MGASSNLDHLLLEVVTLPSLPSVVARITELVNDPESSLTDVGHAIAEDTALALKTLRLVNSAYYGVREQVTSVDHAVTMLGMKVVKNVVFTAAVLETLDSSQERLIRHNVACGIAMRTLSESSSITTVGTADESFIFGLLHDAGKLILGEYLPEESRTIHEMCASKGMAPVDAERELIGTDHAELGARLAKHWKLSSHLIDAIAGHHALERCESIEHRRSAALLSIADFVAHAAGMGTHEDSAAAPAPEMWSEVGLELEEMGSVVDEVRESARNVDELVELCA